MGNVRIRELVLRLGRGHALTGQAGATYPQKPGGLRKGKGVSTVEKIKVLLSEAGVCLAAGQVHTAYRCYENLLCFPGRRPPRLCLEMPDQAVTLSLCPSLWHETPTCEKQTHTPCVLWSPGNEDVDPGGPRRWRGLSERSKKLQQPPPLGPRV